MHAPTRHIAAPCKKYLSGHPPCVSVRAWPRSRASGHGSSTTRAYMKYSHPPKMPHNIQADSQSPESQYVTMLLAMITVT